jgi:hypothetical protein
VITLTEKFKLSQENIEQIEKMMNNVISTVEGSDDMEIKIIDTRQWESYLNVGIDSHWKKDEIKN